MAGGRIRMATVADAEAIDQINRKMLPENYEVDHIKQGLSYFPGLTHIYEDDQKKPCGYILVFMENRSSAYVMSFAMLECGQRQGLGTALLRKAFEASKKKYCAKQIRLHVRQSNNVAQRLYEREGFEMSEVCHNYYDNEDGLLMTKKL